MSSFVQRMVGAAKLKVATYEEVEGDTGATKQAVAVVFLSALAAGIGAIGQEKAGAPLAGIIGALIGWFLWAWVTWLIGTKILPEPQTQADLGQLLRTTGFSASPGILRVFGFIPGLYLVISFVTAVWMLCSMVVAVRQALDYRGTGRAIGVCVIGFLFYLAVAAAVGLFIGGFGAFAGTGQ